MARNQWLVKPSLRTDEDQHKERRTSWLELFFDLILVVVVAEVAHILSEDISWKSVGSFILLFIPAWWVWLGNTVYTERFEANDIGQRLATFLMMLPLAGMAYFAHHGTTTTANGFALSYATARIILILLWSRGAYYDHRMLPTVTRYNIGFTLSVVLFISSTFVDTPYKFILWIAGLFCDLFAPLTTIKFRKDLPKYSSSRMPERFGLFTIIVLGEAVVSIVRGASSVHSLTMQTAIAAAIAMFVVFNLWAIYFDQIMPGKAKYGTLTGFAWSYAHMLLMMSIVALSAGVTHFISSAGEQMTANDKWLILLSLAAIFYL